MSLWGFDGQKPYRWWTCGVWRHFGDGQRNIDAGIKLGPLTISTYIWDRREWGVFILRRGIDTGIIRAGGPWVIR
jgi:hypothetical protein